MAVPAYEQEVSKNKKLIVKIGFSGKPNCVYLLCLKYTYFSKKFKLEFYQNFSNQRRNLMFFLLFYSDFFFNT